MARGYGIANFGDAYFGVTKYVDASASASVSAANTATVEKIHLVSSSISGQSSYNASANITANSGSLTTGTSVITSASAVTFHGIVGITSSSSASVSGVLVVQPQALSYTQDTNSCSAVTIKIAQINIPSELSASASMYRDRDVNATIAASITSLSSARFKYEQISKDNENWTDVPSSGGTWTEVA